MKRPLGVDIGLIVLVGVGWGLLAPATKALFGAVPSAFDGPSVAAARGAWAFAPFVVMLVVTRPRPFPRIGARRWAAMAGAGLLFGCGITEIFTVAAMHTSIAHLSFLIGSSPVTNSAAAALAFRLPLRGRERAALALGAAGVALLAVSRAGGSAELSGDLLMLLWLACFAVYAVLLRYAGPGLSSGFVMSAVGTVAMGSILLASAPVPGALRGIAHVCDTPAAAAWFFGEIVLGSTLIAQTAYAGAVRRFGVATATIGAEYTALGVGIAYSLAVHEPWSWLTVAAGVLLVAALAVTFSAARTPIPRLDPSGTSAARAPS